MKILHIVHCIDTEGPLTEDLSATFSRLKDIFGIELEPTRDNLEKLQTEGFNYKNSKEIAKIFSKDLLNYNNSWEEIDTMLDKCLSDDFRKQVPDDFGSGWVYSWHCMDHVGYSDNPRRKDLGFGNVFRFYKAKLKECQCEKDEINWHFHPMAFDRNPLKAATSYSNNMDVLLEILSRRIIDESWFPTVNRPGFHSERPDSHLFMEQWIPYDYANQRYDYDDGQRDLINGRFGDWRRAPKYWWGYHPDIYDYQSEGNAKRKIFRCLNVGTRFNLLKENHITEAFLDASENGQAILSFANHDYRDIVEDINYVRNLVNEVKKTFPDVKVKYSGAEEAARLMENLNAVDELKLESHFEKNKLIVNISKGEIFGPQPFLAIKTKSGQYIHDNFDVVEFGKKYMYIFDNQTISISAIEAVGVASSGKYGKFDVNLIKL